MQKYRPFAPGEVKPAGWLKRQLELQARGLSGNLDKVWPDVRDSRWIGGEREGWERVPYWLDGFVPLAYLLGDEDMIARAKRYIDAIVAGQAEDGWLCPCTPAERAGYDMWALYLIDKVLMLYYDCSGDERIPGVVSKSLQNLREHIEEHPVFAWAHSRWFECLIPIFRLYGITHEEWLLELGRTLRRQGMDYETLYAHWPHKAPKNEWRQDSHVVNQAMAIKEGALSSLLDLFSDGDEDGAVDDGFSAYMLSRLFRYHGTAAGHFTGDECLSGDSPVQGTELCGVVEAMYSDEILFALTGDPVWADRCEKLAFNALPATLSPDLWSHQYDQMVNQPACVRGEGDKVHFRTNGPESHLFGLEPNYGCCTANFNQGWPKFALFAVLEGEDGIVVASPVPVRLETRRGNVPVTVEVESSYPFGGTVNVFVTVDGEAAFTLFLRVPSAAKRATVDGEEAKPGTVVPLRRTWRGRSVVRLSLDFAVAYVPRPRGMFAIERGPLVYALPIGEDWRKIEYTRDGVERKYPYCDWEIRPTTPWEYAFVPGEVTVEEKGVGEIPFSPDGAPIELSVPVVPVDWGWQEGYTMVPNVTPRSTKPVGEVRAVRFIPYGATDLRMTELPFAEE